MKNKTYFPALLYAVTTLIVAFPLLLPGYVLTLDLVFTPKIPLPTYVSASYPFWALLHYLNVLVPSQLIEKVLLVAVLFGSGYGMYRLASYLLPQTKSPKVRMWACYFAGICFSINPFVYSRFMAGQLAVLLGYTLLPFFVYYFHKFLGHPEWKGSLYVSGLVVAIGIVSIHTLGMAVLLAVCLSAVQAWDKRKDVVWLKDFTKWSTLGALLFLIVSSYWLVPLLRGTSQTSHIIAGFGQSDFSAFATGGRGLGVLGNILGLQGFWGDSKNLFLVPQDVFGWWVIPVIILWVVVLAGIVNGWRKNRRLTIAFLGAGIVAAICAAGVSGTFLDGVNRWIINTVPFFGGYREPQKFVAILAFVYAFFGAIGLMAMVEWVIRHKSIREYASVVALIVCLIPVFCAPLMIGGFHGKLKAVDYPVEWYALNEQLAAQCTGQCSVLFLPWHLYMHYDFAGRIIADPAPNFFSSKIISSNDPELKGASSYSMSATQKNVVNVILPAGKHDDTHMASMLLRDHIQYVLLAKEDDYRHYGFLDKQQGMKVVMNTPTLKLYKVEQ